MYVTNTAKLPWSGWVTMLASCLRADYRSVEDPATGAKMPLERRHGLRPYDDANPQIREWQQEADRYNFIVVAPELRTCDTLVIVPPLVIPDAWYI